MDVLFTEYFNKNLTKQCVIHEYFSLRSKFRTYICEDKSIFLGLVLVGSYDFYCNWVLKDGTTLSRMSLVVKFGLVEEHFDSCKHGRRPIFGLKPLFYVPSFFMVMD